MVKIRKNVFETNSSSTHSISINYNYEENDEPIDSRDIKIVKKLYRCLNKAVQEETNSNLQFDYQSDFRYMDDYDNNIFDILDFNSSDDEDEIVKHFKNIIFDDNFFILYEDVV